MILATLVWLIALALAASESPTIVFPDWANVIDVQRDHGAVGDGTTEDTAAIQAAIDAAAGDQIVYFPAGTYLVSDQLRFGPSDQPDSKKGGHKRQILQGEHRDRTVIKLADGCPGFTQAPKLSGDRKKDEKVSRRGVIWCGTAPAQRFRNAVWDLTIDTGSGNHGASGLQFVANNQGTVRRVTIRSGDGQGYAGLDLGYTGENGPLYVGDLRVEGFRYGIQAGAFNSCTLERIELSGQSEAGIVGRFPLFIRDLRSDNRVPAIIGYKFYSTITVLGAELRGGSPDTAAILSDGVCYVRDVETEGYQRALRYTEKKHASSAPEGQDITSGMTIDGPTLDQPVEPLGLAVPAVPDPAWEDDFSKWANPMDHGAAGDGKTDDTAAIQAAIDTPGKTVLFFPADLKFRIAGDVIVRGSIQRITGGEGIWWNRGEDGESRSRVYEGRIIVGDEAPALVVIERIDNMYGGVRIHHDGPGRVVVRHMKGDVHKDGPGDIFCTDMVGSLHAEGGRAWCRQLNVELPGSGGASMTGGDLWILGLKTENRGTKVACTGGRLELFGGYIYSNTRDKAEEPLIDLVDSRAFVTAVIETKFGKDVPYDIYLRSREGSDMRQIERSESPHWRFVTMARVGGE
jgi:hypothetical protein